MTERVMIYLDGGNFYKACKNAFSRQIRKFDEFGRWLAGDKNLIRLNFYDALKLENRGQQQFKSQQRFHSALQKQDGVKIHLGRLQVKSDNVIVEKGVDIKLATHLLVQAYSDAYDLAIIVSADGDYTEAIEEAQKKGKKVWVALVKEQKAHHLSKVCDKVLWINDISEFC